MKILWLVNVVMPEAAKLFGVSGAASGGWLEGQLNRLRKGNSMTVVAVSPQTAQIVQGIVNGVEYVLLPKGGFEEFVAVLGRVQPALIHIWGSEYKAAGELFDLCDPDHTLLSVQGVMTACAAHLNDGVPQQVIHASLRQKLLDSLVPGHLPEKMQAEFDAAAAEEQALLARVHHVTGRTQWDKEQMKALAPNAVYYPCGEILREEFYLHAGEWQPKDFGDAPTLFLSAGNYPLKGLHRLIPALAEVKKVYPKVKLNIAGWKPVDKGAALRWLTDAIFPYEKWCRELAAQLGVWESIHYTGPLDASGMLEQYLAADCFCLCSSIENSPNSLGEAMLLGLPCVASKVGGVPSLAADGKTALLYPAEDSKALADQLLRVLGDSALAAGLGKAASRAAAQSYSLNNADDMYEIYGKIMDSTAPLDYFGGLT